MTDSVSLTDTQLQTVLASIDALKHSGGVYGVIKDFAQPAATLLAAVAVGFFAYRQWRTAHEQSQTAIDKLRYDVFAKRYDIYTKVRQSIAEIVNNSERNDFSIHKVNLLLSSIDEADFFFSPPICQWLQLVRSECQKAIELQAGEKDGTTNPRDTAASHSKLIDYFRSMPKQFRDDLTIRQITRGK